MRTKRKRGQGVNAQIRVTKYAAQCLDEIYVKVKEDIAKNPHFHPLLVGKDPTYSDIIILLCLKAKNEHS